VARGGGTIVNIASVTALPQEIVMSADDMVEAALVGLDLGESVTIPALADPAGWQRLEAARLDLGPHLSHSEPAARYKAASRVA
jgi:hypothetical protein